MKKCEWCKEKYTEDNDDIIRAEMLKSNGRWTKVCLLKKDFKFYKNYDEYGFIQIFKGKKNEFFILRNVHFVDKA